MFIKMDKNPPMDIAKAYFPRISAPKILAK
jgi:hypothetical protein